MGFFSDFLKFKFLITDEVSTVSNGVCWFVVTRVCVISVCCYDPTQRFDVTLLFRSSFERWVS